MKYIILKVGVSELPIVFSELIQHSDIAAVFNHPVVGAGFVQYDRHDKLEVLGLSTSLKIVSRAEDLAIINTELEPWVAP